MQDVEESLGEKNTFPKLLLHHANVNASSPAYRQKNLGIWQTINWSEAAEKVKNIALGLLSIGLVRGDKVAIIGQNTSALYLSFTAIQAIGAIPVPLYPDNTADEMSFILKQADVRAAICQDQEQVDKVESLKDQIASIEFVIHEELRGMRHYDKGYLHSIEALAKMGIGYKKDDPNAFRRIASQGSENDLAIIIYTPGTTGDPKGVMLTYRALQESAQLISESDKIGLEENILAYLPLAWIGDHLISYAQHHVMGYTINCPESPDTLLSDLKDIGPSYFMAPPRIFERLLTQVNVRIESTSSVVKSLYNYFMSVAQRVGGKILDEQAVGIFDRFAYALGNIIIYGPIKNNLGFNHIKVAYTGGAPIGKEVFSFYRSIGVNLKQMYAQTESSAYTCLHRTGDVKLDTVGPAAPGVEIKINNNGEIFYQSPGNFVGYYNDDKATKKALDKDGWLRSGDAGNLAEDGHLRILDRCADVGKVNNGALFAPQSIENRLKFSPYIQEAIAVGDGREFVTAVINIDSVAIGNLLEKLGISFSGYSDLSQQSKVYDLIREYIEALNKQLSEDIKTSSLQIKRFSILHKQLDPIDGDLTQTGKLRRKVLTKRLKKIIDALYTDKEEVQIDLAKNAGNTEKKINKTTLRICNVSVTQNNEQGNS